MKSIASNGFYVQEIQEEDAEAFMKCFKDYPLSPDDTPITYEERLTKFSQSLLTNEAGTLPLTETYLDGVYRVWGLYKADHTFVSTVTYGFMEAGEALLLNCATHPSHRNQGYIYAWHAFMNKSIYPHYSITSIKTVVEASPAHAGATAAIATSGAAGANINAGDKTSSDWMRDASGNTVAEKEVTTTRSIGTSIANANDTWKNVTFTIS